MSVKGGVGKTTAAVNLAHLAAARGARVLVWDLDPQGASTYLLRVDDVAHGGRHAGAPEVSITDHERLDVVHAPDFFAPSKDAGAALESAFVDLAPWYDVVVFDCAAGLDPSSGTVAGLADAVLVPLLPTPLAVRTLVHVDRLVARHGGDAPVMPFFSMVDRRRRLHRDTIEALQLERITTLSAQIVDTAVVERMAVHRRPVVVDAPDSAVAHAYRALWSELEVRLRTRAGAVTSVRAP
jgi:cellulose biosynthesis protein BcsQ